MGFGEPSETVLTHLIHKVRLFHSGVAHPITIRDTGDSQRYKQGLYRMQVGRLELRKTICRPTRSLYALLIRIGGVTS